MKRILLFSAISMAFASNSYAFEQNDTIVNVSDAKQVQIVTNDSVLNISIDGIKENPAYHFEYKQSIKGNVTSFIEEQANWDFSILPLPGQKKKKKINVNSTYVDLGLSSAVNAPSNMNVNIGASWSIYWNVCNLVSIQGRRSALSIGVGFGWKNFRLKDDLRFSKIGNKIELTEYPENASIDFSRIKQFHISFPLSFAYSFSKNAYIDIAAILNLNTHASIKTRYSLDGKKQKDLDNKIHHNPTSVDFRLALYWKNLGWYVKYNPVNVLNTTYGPKFQTWSTGISLGI